MQWKPETYDKQAHQIYRRSHLVDHIACLDRYRDRLHSGTGWKCKLKQLYPFMRNYTSQGNSVAVN